MRKLLILLLCVVLLAALIVGALIVTREEEQTPIANAGTAQNAAAEPEFLTYQGTEYPIKAHLQTVLLIGTDSQEQYHEKENSLQDYYNFNQADFLMLLVMDTDANTTEVIQLNRDTMTDVPWLDVLGNYGGTEYKQLCLAFNYGDGGRKSCLNTVDAVSGLLFDTPIQNYIQIPMTAIPVLNDLVGGVEVTMPQDYTEIDPAFTQGATVRLSGAQAEAFVRSRMGLENDTNLARMERQRLYMDSFQAQARKAFNSDSEFALKLVEKLSDYLQSDLTAQQLSDLAQRLDKSTVSPIRIADGQLVEGEEHYEFYVDEASLWELVRTAYCQE